MFDEGLTDMKAGRYKLGCALIKQSLDVDPRAGTLFTLAECYSRAGKYASAVEEYDRYLALVQTMPADEQQQQAERVVVSRTTRTRLVALVSWLTVNVPSPPPPGLVVTKDGEDFPSTLFGVATAVDPGPHVFTTRTPDTPLIEQRIDIAEGERKQIVLDVEPAIPEPAEPPQNEQPEPPTAEHGGRAHHLTPWVYVAGGIGAAGLVTGAVAGGLLLAKRQTIMDQCKTHYSNGQIGCTSEGYSAANFAQNTLAPVTEVALSVGVAGAAATVLLLVLDGGSSAPPPKAGSLTPVASVGRSGTAFGVRGAF